MRLAMLATLAGPSDAMRWPNAQLTEPAVAARSDSTLPLYGSAFAVVQGAYPFAVTTHGDVPSMVSFGE